MLDTPVAQLLADFKIASGGDKDITLGDLATHYSGLPRMPTIFPSAPNAFFARIAGISMTFKRNPEGAVDGLVLHQNGDRAAPRRIEAKETERHSVSDMASGLLSEVRLLNDDHTPMEFVASVLQCVFGKDSETATRITLKIHNDGARGIYPHDVADAKVTEVFDLARQHKHPLQCVRERITSVC